MSSEESKMLTHIVMEIMKRVNRNGEILDALISEKKATEKSDIEKVLELRLEEWRKENVDGDNHFHEETMEFLKDCILEDEDFVNIGIDRTADAILNWWAIEHVNLKIDGPAYCKLKQILVPILNQLRHITNGMRNK